MKSRPRKSISTSALFAGALLLLSVACSSDPDADENSNQENQITDNTDENKNSAESNCDESTALSEDIISDTTLAADCYDIDDVLNIEAALTLEAGAVLRFSNDGGFIVANEGSLLARGTEQEKIILTSQDNSQAPWKGVVIFSDSSDNTLDHVIIEHAGAINYDSLNKAITSALILRENGQIHIANSIIQDNAGAGIRVHSTDAQLASFENNYDPGRP